MAPYYPDPRNPLPQAPAAYDPAKAQQRYSQDQDDPYDACEYVQDNPHPQNPNLPPGASYLHASAHAYQPSIAGSHLSLDQTQWEQPNAPNFPYSHAHTNSRTGLNPVDSQVALTPGANTHSRFSWYKETDDFADLKARSARRKRITLLAIIGALIAVAAVAVPVYFLVIKPKLANHASTAPGKAAAATGAAGATAAPHTLVTTGGDGSTVTTADGTTFTYTNSFDGFWVDDPTDPFNNNAQAQSDSPPLNASWNFGVDRIRGVNIGGWLVLEPFITPALFEKYPGTVDEFTLSTAMAADTASGGLSQIEEHYKTFITEQDFAQIAGAGLNWVRIPIAFWAIETWDGINGESEPYLAKVSWTYFLQAISWARKYGLRINLDYHATPGSQNGFNHSGKLGSINFLSGIMGIANVQRTITYLQTITQFISQPQYKDVVPIFSILNEAFMPKIGQPQMESFYLMAYSSLRAITGVGEGKGPMLAIHDGFTAMSSWAGVFPNADRLALDTHQYFCFTDQQSAAPLSSFIPQPCSAFQPPVTKSLQTFGMTFGGEFSLAINDCGLNVNGIGLGTRFEGTFVGDNNPPVGNCSVWDVWEDYTDDTKAQLKQFAMTQMDALQNWFFWTWKIGNSTEAGAVRAPFWSYQLGLQQGWMPTNPAAAVGACGTGGAFSGTLQPWQTGGVGADTIPAATSAALAWPPASITNAGPAIALPTYTPTGTITPLPAPTLAPSANVDPGNGLANPGAPVQVYVPVAGCAAAYVDEYSGVGAPLPTAACAVQSPAAIAAPPTITSPPDTPTLQQPQPAQPALPGAIGQGAGVPQQGGLPGQGDPTQQGGFGQAAGGLGGLFGGGGGGGGGV